MTKLWHVGLVLLAMTGAAAAQCPAVNVYPFTSGCPLPAASLNAAFDERLSKSVFNDVTPGFLGLDLIDIAPPTGGLGNNFLVRDTADPAFINVQPNALSLMITEKRNGLVVYTYNNRLQPNPNQPSALSGIGILPATTGAGNVVFGANFQSILYAPGAGVGTEFNSENNFGPPNPALPPPLGFGLTEANSVGIQIVAEGLYDSNIALYINSHTNPPQDAHYLTGIYMAAGKVLNNGIFIDAVAGAGGSPTITATFKNSGAGGAGVNNNLLLQTVGGMVPTGLVMAVAEREDNRMLSIRQNGDLYSVGTSRFARYASPLLITDDNVVNTDLIGFGYDGVLAKGSFTGFTSGTTLTITSVVSGAIAVGDNMEGLAILPGTTVTAFGTGVGGVGTYTINLSQTNTSDRALTTSLNQRYASMNVEAVSTTEGAHSGDIIFAAANNGSNVQKARLFANGDFAVTPFGGSAIATTSTGWFLMLSSMAGPPTGVPTHAAAGRTAMVWDTTNKKLCAYNQPTAAWTCSAAFTP